MAIPCILYYTASELVYRVRAGPWLYRVRTGPRHSDPNVGEFYCHELDGRLDELDVAVAVARFKDELHELDELDVAVAVACFKDSSVTWYIFVPTFSAKRPFLYWSRTRMS